MKICGPLCAALLAAAWAPRPAQGSLVLAMNLEEMTAAADRIVVGEVLAVTSRWSSRRERILSNIEVQVSESWKGAMPGDGRLTIVQPGGSADGIEMIVHGMPLFTPGERAVLFLREVRPGALALVGLGQGRRPLTFDAAKRLWMVGGGDRQAAVVREPRGSLTPAAPVAPVPLIELRRRISGLLRK